MAKRTFTDDNLADPGTMSESSMLEISFGDGDIFGNATGVFDKSDVVEKVDPKELTLLENNPMNMDQDDNWKALKYSIEETGVWEENPIIIEKTDDGRKVVLAGNRRTLISQQLNLPEVPVIYKTFESDEHRRRYIDATNTHRDPKLIDILNRYEFNAKLYDDGYWKDSPIGRMRKLDAVSAIIGYPASKVHNIIFLLDIKKSHERIIHLIDEDALVVSDIRALTVLENKGKLVDYEAVLTKICEDEDVNDIELSSKERKQAAKNIIKNAEVKGKKKNIEDASKKKAHVEFKALEKKICKTIDDELSDELTEKQKGETIETIERIMEKLSNYIEKVKTL